MWYWDKDDGQLWEMVVNSAYVAPSSLGFELTQIVCEEKNKDSVMNPYPCFMTAIS